MDIRNYLQNYIQNKGTDQHLQETYLAKNYNEFLQCQDMIEQIDISQHYRILQKAIEHDSKNQISYDLFASFLLKQFEKGKKDMEVLLELIDIKKLQKDDLIKFARCKNIDIGIIKIPNDFILESINNIEKYMENINKYMGEMKKFVESNIYEINRYITEEYKTINEQIKKIDNQNINITKDINKLNESFKLEIVNANNQTIVNQNNIKDIISEINSIKTIMSLNQKENKELILKEIGDIKIKISQSHENNKNANNQILSKIQDCKESINNENNSMKSQISLAQKENKELITQKSNEVINKLLTNQNEIKNLISQKCDVIQTNLSDKNDNNKKMIKSSIDELQSELKANQNLNKNSIISKIEYIQCKLSSSIVNEKNSFKEIIKNIYEFITLNEMLPITFSYDKDNLTYFDGLFNYCYSKIGNPFDKKIFKITGNSEYGYEYILNCLCNSSNYKVWKSKNESNSYIQIDFLNKFFSFKAIEVDSNVIMRNFCIEGSNTGSDWKIVGNWSNQYTNFIAQSTNYRDDYYRFLRLKMKGQNSSNNYCLCIIKFELYGILK